MKWWMWIFVLLRHTGISHQDPDVAGSYSVKICSLQRLDQSQQSPCPLGTGINVTSITYGVRESDVSCTQFPSSFTCVRQMEEIYPAEFEAWKQTCDGKIVCDNQRAAPALPVSCDGHNATTNVIELKHECVPSPPDIRVSSTCVGSYIADLTCPHGFLITIFGIYMADNPQLGTCRAAETTYSCTISITSDKSLSFWHTLLNACHHKPNCSEPVVAEAVRNSQCATVNNVVTDYVLIQYRCLSDLRYTHRCDGYTVDDLFCSKHEVLHIINVAHGDINETLTDEQCRGGEVLNPCYAIRTTRYTKSVFMDCDGKVSCSPEVSIIGTLGACFRNSEMQFVQITFQCAHVSKVPSIPSTKEYTESTTPRMTTPSGTPQTDTTGSSNTVSGPGKTDTTGSSNTVSRSVTIIAASAAGGGVLLVAVIVVTLVCVRRKRHTKAQTESQENTTESSPSINNTSEAPAPSMELSMTSPHSIYCFAQTVRDNTENEAMCDDNNIDPYAEYNGSQPPRDNTAVTQDTDVTAPYATPNKLCYTAQQPVHDDVTAIDSKARDYEGDDSRETSAVTATDDVTAAYSLPSKEVCDDETIIVENNLYQSGGFQN